jgi:hypothetical protein
MMIIEGMIDGLIDILITLEVALGLVIQGELLVTIQLTWSPLFRLLVVNAEVSVPALIPFIFH